MPGDVSQIRTVAVLGAGTMGAGIAQVLAQAGRRVLVHDVRPGAVDLAMSTIGRSLDKFVSKGKLSADQAAATRSNLQPGALAEMSAADLVIEAIFEDAAAKIELFAQINRVADPHVIFASNTSSI
jgi:3-hydroxybutyryl-CoA dehydrogenase